ncbi:hydrolase [Nocardioides sp. CF8]|uniref:HAD family hydrolase n=1 Tax=Nocardioides sp. CF8 TaxID=110319 RepID=UPI00032DBB5F|nr:HAD family hydrolase [Nocardioides sp. CF8]EON22552.1 hydrolase [Nocardioides sp. CF8]
MTDRVVAILFDLDGTLLDSEAVATAAFVEAYEQAGGVGTAPTSDFLGLAGHPFPEICRLLGLPAGMDGFFVQAASRRSGSLRLFPWVDSMLETLTARGARLGIVTGKDRARTREALRLTGLDRHVETVITPDDGLPGKPAAAPVLEAARQLGAARAIFVGDSPADVLAGRAAGAVTIACTWGAAGAERLFEVGPDHLISDPHDLLPLLQKIASTLITSDDPPPYG